MNRLNHLLFRFGNGGSELAAKFFGNKARASAGDIDVFPHQIAVDPRNEIIEIKIDIFHGVVELGGVVVAQPFRIQALIQVASPR